jgi:integrase
LLSLLVDRALMALLIDAGLRKGEARALQVRRLKLDAREVVIVGGKGDEDRIVPMTARLGRLVEELLFLERLDPQDYLWYSRPGGGRPQRGRRIAETTFVRWWQDCLKEAGVRYRNPHTTRHSFATRWLRRGSRLETLSIVMGHASIRTTFDLYGPRYARCGRRDGADGPSLRYQAGPNATNPLLIKRRGAERIRTAVRGFAGLCLTPRPRRRGDVPC